MAARFVAPRGGRKAGEETGMSAVAGSGAEGQVRPLGQARTQHVGDVFPAARAGTDQVVVGQLARGVVEPVGPHLEVGHHRRRVALRKSVRQEGLDGGLHVEVEHAVGQRRTHVVRDRAVEACIAGRDHQPSVRQAVVAHAAVQDQRVRGDLQALVGSRELVEEQDALGGGRCRQELRREPDRLALHVVRVDRAADVHWFDGGQPQVDQRHAEVLRNLLHDRGLANAPRTPEHGRAPTQDGVGELLDQGGLGRGDRDWRDVHGVCSHPGILPEGASRCGYRSA